MAGTWNLPDVNELDPGDPIKSEHMTKLRSSLLYVYDEYAAAASLVSNFDQFAGDGSDGARTDSSTATFAVGASKQLTDWTVDSGVTMTLTTSNAYNVVYIACSGTFTLSGTITTAGGGYAGASGGTGGSDGAAMTPTSKSLAQQFMPAGGAGGGAGDSGGGISGDGGRSYITTCEFNYGGAAGNNSAGSAGQGLYAWRAANDSFAKIARMIMLGHSGGGGGGSAYDGGIAGYRNGGAGGNAGLSIMIECDEFVFNSGASIVTTGNAGSAGTTGISAGGGGGGGGAGGSVIVVCRTLTTNSGTVTVSGGAGGSGGGGDYVGGAGGAGGAGASLILELD